MAEFFLKSAFNSNQSLFLETYSFPTYMYSLSAEHYFKTNSAKFSINANFDVSPVDLDDF